MNRGYNTMSETIDPPIALPPAGLPPYGPGHPDLRPLPRQWSASEVAAAINTICGIVVLISVFLPAFLLSDYTGTVYWSGTNLGDAPYFLGTGMVLTILGVIRLHGDHLAVRIITMIVGGLGVMFAILDADAMQAYFVEHAYGTGLTFTYGPALFMIGFASAGAVVSAIITSDAYARSVNR